MFQQKINLFHAFEEPKPADSILSWRKMIILNQFFILFMSIIVVYSFFNLSYLKNQKITLQQQATTAQNNFFDLKKQYPAAFFSHDGTKSIEALTQDMKTRSQILAKIANHSLFSDDLETLASVIVPNVWLTTINITNGGDSISLKGKSASVTAMQEFLQRLTSDKAFADYSLSVKNIQDNIESKATGDLVFDITMVKNTT